MRIFTLITVLAISSLAALANQNPKAPNHNEDLRYIRKFQMEQKAAETAKALNLSPEQSATLRRIKAQTDEIEASFKPRLEALEQRTATLAAEVRSRIEASGTLSDADKTALKALKAEHVGLKREQREQMKAAAAGLEGLLTDEQVEILRARAREHRGEIRDRMRERRSERVEGRKERKHARADFKQGRQERHHDRAKHLAARLLLSDAFIEATEP